MHAFYSESRKILSFFRIEKIEQFNHYIGPFAGIHDHVIHIAVPRHVLEHGSVARVVPYCNGNVLNAVFIRIFERRSIELRRSQHGKRLPCADDLFYRPRRRIKIVDQPLAAALIEIGERLLILRSRAHILPVSLRVLPRSRKKLTQPKHAVVSLQRKSVDEQRGQRLSAATGGFIRLDPIHRGFQSVLCRYLFFLRVRRPSGCGKILFQPILANEQRAVGIIFLPFLHILFAVRRGGQSVNISVGHLIIIPKVRAYFG